MKTVDEVENNVAFFQGRRDLPAPQVTTRRLHIDDWCIGCGACVRACPNGALELENGKARVVTREKCVFAAIAVQAVRVCHQGDLKEPCHETVRFRCGRKDNWRCSQ